MLNFVVLNFHGWGPSVKIYNGRLFALKNWCKKHLVAFIAGTEKATIILIQWMFLIHVHFCCVGHTCI